MEANFGLVIFEDNIISLVWWRMRSDRMWCRQVSKTMSVPSVPVKLLNGVQATATCSVVLLNNLPASGLCKLGVGCWPTLKTLLDALSAP